MAQSAPLTKYKVKAVHTKPEFPPVVEECPTVTTAKLRAGQLYLSGYTVEIESPSSAKQTDGS